MSIHDQQIIDLHPTATPYELFNDFGISKKGYNELMSKTGNAQNSLQPQKDLVPEMKITGGVPHNAQTAQAAPNNLLVPERVVINRQLPTAPKLSDLKQPIVHGDNVTVVTKSTGKRSSMTLWAASRLVRNQPKDFEIAQ